MATRRLLHDSYYENNSFPNAKKLKAILDRQIPLYRKKKQNVTLREVRDWLSTQDAYTLHKQSYKNFKRNPYYVIGIDHLWESDLVDLSMLKSQNDNYRYLLTVIDVLSKFAWVKCLKNKSARSITKAFREIIDDGGRKPLAVQCDRGGEFKNKAFTSFLRSRGVKLQFPLTTSKFKCAHIEAFNKTFKQRMFRYFTRMGNTRRYIDVLQSLTDAYNNTEHGTIKMKPADVKPHYAPLIYSNTHAKHRRIMQKYPRLKTGDFVRVIKKKPVFEHGYTEKWTREIFVIKDVINKSPYPLYKIRDLKGVDIEGKFYEQELQKVNK